MDPTYIFRRLENPIHLCITIYMRLHRLRVRPTEQWIKTVSNTSFGLLNVILCIHAPIQRKNSNAKTHPRYALRRELIVRDPAPSKAPAVNAHVAVSKRPTQVSTGPGHDLRQHDVDMPAGTL